MNVMLALRTLGIGLIVAALAAVVFDTTLATVPLNVTAISLADLWSIAHPESLNFARVAAQQYLPPQVWDPWLLTLLRLPALLIAGLIGFRLRGQSRARAQISHRQHSYI